RSGCSLQPKSDLSDFGRSIGERTQVSPGPSDFAGANADLNLKTLSDRSTLKQVAELLQRDVSLLLRWGVDRREPVAPVPRPAGVDDGAAVGVVTRRLALRL